MLSKKNKSIFNIDVKKINYKQSKDYKELFEYNDIESVLSLVNDKVNFLINDLLKVLTKKHKIKNNEELKEYLLALPYTKYLLEKRKGVSKKISNSLILESINKINDKNGE